MRLKRSAVSSEARKEEGGKRRREIETKRSAHLSWCNLRYKGMIRSASRFVELRRRAEQSENATEEREKGKEDEAHIVGRDPNHVLITVVLGRVESQSGLSWSDRHVRLSRLERPGEDITLRSVEVDLDPSFRVGGHQPFGRHSRLVAVGDTSESCCSTEGSVDGDGSVGGSDHEDDLRTREKEEKRREGGGRGELDERKEEEEWPDRDRIESRKLKRKVVRTPAARYIPPVLMDPCWRAVVAW